MHYKIGVTGVHNVLARINTIK